MGLHELFYDTSNRGVSHQGEHKGRPIQHIPIRTFMGLHELFYDTSNRGVSHQIAHKGRPYYGRTFMVRTAYTRKRCAIYSCHTRQMYKYHKTPSMGRCLPAPWWLMHLLLVLRHNQSIPITPWVEYVRSGTHLSDAWDSPNGMPGPGD